MRLAWADIARGGAMILVVLAHALQLMDAQGWNNGWLDTANLYLTALRMPLFFLVSGLFAARAIDRSWRGLFASRLAVLLYLYFLWMVARTAWFAFVPWPLDTMPPVQALLLSPVWPTNGLWFLYALVLYLIAGKLTARLPVAMVLVVFGALAVATASGLLPDIGNPVWHSIAIYAFFFLLGARLPRVWSTVADRATGPFAIIAPAAIVASVLVFGQLPDPLQGIGRIVLSLVCVLACIALAAVLSRVRIAAEPLRFVGLRTLPIYVVHTMLLAVLVPVIPVQSVPPEVAAAGLVIVAVVLPVLLRRALPAGSGVFDLPKAWARPLETYAERDSRG